MTTSKKNFEKEYPRVHSMLEELKKDNKELQKENEILLVRPNWITLKKLEKENEELKSMVIDYSKHLSEIEKNNERNK